MKRIILAALTLGLSACASIPQQPPHAIITGDQYSKQIEISGLQAFDNPFGGTSKHWFIRSWVDRDTRKVEHQLYVTIGYMGDWRFYQMAADDTARSLPVTAIDKSVDDCTGGICSFTETVGIGLTDAELRRRRDGFSIKLSAHSGDSVILPLTAEMTDAQLVAEKQTLDSLAHIRHTR